MRESSRIGRQGVADSCGLRYRTGQFVRSGFFFPEMWVAVRILFFFAYNQYSMVMKKYELKNNKALGRYEFDLDGATAVVDYEECGPGCIAVTHTGVPDRFCGQGIASQLTVAAESGSAVSIHGPLYSAASGVEADGCGQVAGGTALYRLRLEIRFWVGSVPCRPFFGYKARGLLPDGEWAGARGNECRLPGF